MATIKPYPKAKQQPAWRLRWYDPILKIRKEKTYLCNKVEANSILKEKEAEILMIKSGKIKGEIHRCKTKIKEAKKEFLEYCEAEGLAKTTLNSYKNSIDNLLYSVGNIAMADINLSHRKSFYKYLKTALDS